MWRDATDQAEALNNGSVSSVELVAETLERIDRVNAHLGAYVCVDHEGALSAARAADRIRKEHVDGEPAHLLGVPMSFKDVEDVAGLPTTHSCRALADNVASDDGPVVRRFRRGGLVVLGKINSPSSAAA